MYHGTGINDSATIVAKAPADIEGGAFLALDRMERPLASAARAWLKSFLRRS